MKHSLKFLLSFLLSFVATTSTASTIRHIFIGNGGDGVEVEGKIFLRDLFSVGIHNDAVIGSGIDPFFLDHIEGISFGMPKALLARKLTDLNSFAPGIGDFVVQVIKAYNWVLIDSPLTPIKPGDDEDPIVLPEGSRLIQIANRLHGQIRITRAAWAKMDEANRVALILHEAIYALMKPTCFSENGDRICAQSAERTREIVSLLFQARSKDPHTFYKYLAAAIEIPREVHTAEEYRPARLIKIETPLEAIQYFLRPGFERDDFYLLANFICTPGIEGEPPLPFTVEFEPLPYALKFTTYLTTGKLKRTQLGVSINWEKSRTPIRGQYRPSSQCWSVMNNVWRSY